MLLARPALGDSLSSVLRECLLAPRPDSTMLLARPALDADDDSLLVVLQTIDVTEAGLARVCMLAQASRGCSRAVRALLADGRFRRTVARHREFKRELAVLLDAPSTVTCRVVFMRAVDADDTTNIGRILRHARLCHEDVGLQYGVCKLIWTSFLPQACKVGTMHYEACETAGREGAFDVLLLMLRAHPLEVKLLVTVCWALCFLIQCAESNRTRFLQTDGVERLLALEHESCRPGVLSSAITADNSSRAMYPDAIQGYLTRHSLRRGIVQVCNTLTSQSRARDDAVVYHGREAERVAAARAAWL